MKQSTQEQRDLIAFCLQAFGEGSSAKNMFDTENIKSYEFCQWWLDRYLPLAKQIYQDAAAERCCW